ncbi:hypothetical protein CDL12_06898 [Handroanthus impetiginosus]|uniref:Uncharacterized protein n=1 Tax=Handroanthus impetiginosus TaxID=429701 RepID=A0A2G9HSC1_9LAMI|nr:hypothetical protein CDL12_06898 [Handroanthus impetiginosus]
MINHKKRGESDKSFSFPFPFCSCKFIFTLHPFPHFFRLSLSAPSKNLQKYHILKLNEITLRHINFPLIITTIIINIYIYIYMHLFLVYYTRYITPKNHADYYAAKPYYNAAGSSICIFSYSLKTIKQSEKKKND